MNLISRDRAKSIEQDAGSSSRWQILASWCLSLLYMAVIFFLSAQSDLPLPYWGGGEDFFLHMAEYGVLGFLLSWALLNSGVIRKLVLYVFLMGLLYGLTDELHQYFVPGRVASLLDVTADGLSSLLGSYSFRLIRSVKSTT